MFKSKTLAAAAVLTCGLACTNAFAQNVLEADFSAPKTEVSKNLFGIFYEDINYAADGGLYGEMVQNRSFEFRLSRKSPTENWKLANLNGAKATSKVKGNTKDPLNKNNTTFATLRVAAEGDGITNNGYGGMPLEKGKKYPGSVYLRSTDGSVKSVTVTVGDKKSFAKINISGITDKWQKFTFDAVAVETTDKGQIGIFADQTGILDIDFVSLFRADIYKNQPNGLRADLAQKLEDMHPAFMRFPGGCIVHGLDLQNRYQWKDTVGPVEERKEKANFWGYQQSYGIGFYEYFRLCEDIGAEPLPVLSVGMAHNGERSSMSDMPSYIQDALDLIEYATGPADSKWGKVRADAGHPAPFTLNYIGIGNEDCGEGVDGYSIRFKQIAQAVKAKYPNIKTIMSTGYTYNDVNFHTAWEKERGWEADKKIGKLADLMDEHYYNESSWFLTNGNRYDNLDFYPRDENKAKVFIGEYASWVDGRKNNLMASLTEAAYMTSIERNGDIVEISSYAPLFARAGFTQWTPDMIWFNQKESYGTPAYYVQQLFMTKKSDQTVKSNLTQSANEVKEKFIGGTCGLGTWQTNAQFSNVKLTNADTNTVLYDSNAKTATIDDFRCESGDWSKKGKIISQTSQGDNMRAILDNEVEIAGTKNYDFEVTATKLSGAEGFLIIFGSKGKNLYWWNMGGWGNTQSCVEKGTADGRSIIGDAKPLNLSTGKAYKIKVEVRGESYKCYLDGQLMHEFTDVMNFDNLYTHVGETKDKVIVKIVNISKTPQPVEIKLNGCPALASTAVVTTISGDELDENSFTKPENVVPKTSSFNGVSSDFTYTVDPYSVTVLELQKK